MANNSEFDIDLIRDDQNPVYQNLKIYKERVSGILDTAIEKMEISYCLDDLLRQDGSLIRDYLPKEDLQYILEGNVNYGDEFSIAKASMLKPKTIKSELKSKSRILKATIGLEVKFVDDFYSNVLTKMHRVTEIRQLAKKILYRKSLSTIEFYVLMKELRNYMKKKFNTTATEELKYDKQLVVAYHSNDRYIKKNAELSETYEAQTQELVQSLTAKHSMIDQQQFIKTEMNDKCLDEILTIVLESEFQMSKVSTESDELMQNLAEEAKKKTAEYQLLLDSHLTEEKQLRFKRSKIEMQLANWIATYDNDVGGLTNTYDEFKKEYDEADEELRALQAKFDEQEKEYVVLMEEKRIEEYIIWSKKYYKFIKERSARRIQKWWNEVWISKKKKKKKKKGKK